MGQRVTVPAAGVASTGTEGPGPERGSSSLRDSRTQGSLVLSHLQRCGPSRRSHHGAAVSHLLQELQQGQILISRKIPLCTFGGLCETAVTFPVQSQPQRSGLISPKDRKPQGSHPPGRTVPSALLTLLSTGMFASEPKNPKATGKKLLH